MVENATAQAQKAFNDGLGMVKKVTEENMERVETFMGEWQKAQEKSIAHTQQTLDEASKLVKENMEYGMKMSAELQKLAVASSKQAFEIFSSVKV